jgi:Mg-chelatase subunit ChlD
MSSTDVPSDAFASGSSLPAGTDVPSEFLCPITYEVMTDPVTLSDGHTYERTAIEQWLQTHNTSPLSNSRVSLADLKPNYALRSAIERFLAANPTALGVSGSQQAPVNRTFRARTDGEHLFVECLEQEPLEVVTILVNDVSGSMGSPSSNPGAATAAEGALFSRLDLVKHANRTVAAMHAAQGASLGIITFSDTAVTVLPVKKMDVTGLADAERAVAGMRLEGGTNMWAGLQEALKQAAGVAKAKPNAFINIIFLTDGEPTPDYIPRVGLVEALRRRLTVKVTLNCFGFGYALDAKLLQELCTLGGGIYGYLPDCSMVGSVSINAAAAALSTVATDVRVGSIHLGSIQAGATRFVKMPATVDSVLEVSYANGGKASVTVERATELESDNAKIVFKLKEMLLDASHSREFFPENQAKVETMLSWIGDENGENPFATAVKQDIKHADDHKGQILKALKSSDWYNSWGLNHLISYIRALDQQQCVNFKDAALQHYATDLFRRIQDKGNDLFDNLPVPKPSCASSYGSYGGAAYRGVGTLNLPTNMAGFNTAQGGCWTGNCRVQMADNTWRMTHQLRAGDSVLGGHRILCVVRTRHTKPMKLMRSDELTITPWHPIRLAFAKYPEWVFPCESEAAEAEPVEEFAHYVYNLVLESGHYVRIGVYDVCTLGHCFNDNDVIKHEYFGTYKVIQDLMMKPGWSQGLVTLEPDEQKRGDDGRVISCRPRPPAAAPPHAPAPPQPPAASRR